MSFFRLFQHLLPQGRAWNLTASKRLREFFQGLSGLGSDIKDFLDLVWLDSQPADTRELDAWEAQFGLGGGATLTTAERRERLDAAWKALGGQSPRYIQDTLQAAGFDVYVHEWWAPGTEPALGIPSCTAARNPASYVVSVPSNLNEGYVLVNQLYSSRTVILPRAGVAAATAGSSLATAGRFSTFVDEPKEYPIPLDPDCWHYFLYIGGETFPELATLPPERRKEFEELCLKICPSHLWLGILVGFNPSGSGSGPLALAAAIYESLDFVRVGSAKLDLSAATYESLDFVEGGSSALDLAGGFYEKDPTAPPAYITLGGITEYISTPDSSSYSTLSNGLEVIMQLTVSDEFGSGWQPSFGDPAVLAQQAEYRYSDQAWRLWLDANDIWFEVVTTGDDYSVIECNIPAGFSSFTISDVVWIKATWDAATGAMSISYALGLGTPSSWTALSVNASDIYSGTMRNSAQPIILGRNVNRNTLYFSPQGWSELDGRIYYFELNDGPGGTTLARFDASDGTDPTYNNVSGETAWTNTGGTPS